VRDEDGRGLSANEPNKGRWYTLYGHKGGKEDAPYKNTCVCVCAPVLTHMYVCPPVLTHVYAPLCSHMNISPLCSHVCVSGSPICVTSRIPLGFDFALALTSILITSQHYQRYMFFSSHHKKAISSKLSTILPITTSILTLAMFLLTATMKRDPNTHSLTRRFPDLHSLLTFSTLMPPDSPKPFALPKLYYIFLSLITLLHVLFGQGLHTSFLKGLAAELASTGKSVKPKTKNKKEPSVTPILPQSSRASVMNTLHDATAGNSEAKHFVRLLPRITFVNRLSLVLLLALVLLSLLPPTSTFNLTLRALLALLATLPLPLALLFHPRLKLVRRHAMKTRAQMNGARVNAAAFGWFVAATLVIMIYDVQVPEATNTTTTNSTIAHVANTTVTTSPLSTPLFHSSSTAVFFALTALLPCVIMSFAQFFFVETSLGTCRAKRVEEEAQHTRL